MKTLLILLSLLLTASMFGCDSAPSPKWEVVTVSATNGIIKIDHALPIDTTTRVDITKQYSDSIQDILKDLGYGVFLYVEDSCGHLSDGELIIYPDVCPSYIEDTFFLETNDTCVAWINSHKKYTSIFIDNGDFVDLYGNLWIKVNCELPATPKQPLRIKIDTVKVGVDTIGLEQIERKTHIDKLFIIGCNDAALTSYPPQFRSCDVESHMIIDSVWVPITDTTYFIDSLYDLTPEQVELLQGGVK